MENTENDAIKEYAKDYFKGLIKACPDNLRLGDKLTFGIRYINKDGSVGCWQKIVEVTKQELDGES